MKKNVLEIGCGQGFHAYCLSKKNNIIGVDSSSEDILIARKRFPGVDFRVMDIEKLEFSGSSFDQVYALDVLEHVDNLDQVIAGVQRVLKPGGEFIVNIPYWKSENWLLKLRPSYFDEIHHVRIFSENSLEKIMADNNFGLIKKRRSGFLSHIFQYYMFKRKISSGNQLGIGHWRDNWKTKFLYVSLMFFDPELFKTPLKYCPLWLLTLPVGFLINLPGNVFFPKSLFYKFRKNG